MRSSATSTNTHNSWSEAGMSILYKEYLDEDEAADYMCVSKSCFNEHKAEWGVICHRLPGVAKNVYKRHELHAIMENGLKPWQPSINAEETGISNGLTPGVRNALASLKSTGSKQHRKPKTTDSQKNSNSGPAQQ